MDDSRNSNKEFNRALHNFTMDLASGDAIRHLADLGYTVREIREKLHYPTPIAQIKNVVWKKLVDDGTILLEDPATVSCSTKKTYETRKDEFGKTYFVQILDKGDSINPADYYRCDFGRMIYKDAKGFEDYISALNPREKEYLLNLPWPLCPVWHKLDERFSAIVRKLL